MKINPKITSAPNFMEMSHLSKQMLATIPSCLISLCGGMISGLTAVMLPQLREDKTILYNPSHESWIASISALSMVIGSLSSGHILDRYGRKTSHVILGIPFAIGWMTIACSRSSSMIILGRFLTGLSAGANKAVIVVYIGELTSPRIRSFALIIPNVFRNIGIVLSHVIGYYLHWLTNSYIGIVIAVTITVTSLFLKESPLWLIAKGRTDEGIKVFRWFRGTDDASDAELKAILERQSEKPKTSVKETLKTVRSKTFIKPMLILLVVMLNMPFCGVAVISHYSQDIFRQTFLGNVDPFIMVVVMDFIISIMSICMCFLGKYVPKKKTYLFCNFGVSVFVAGLVACLLVGYDRYIWLPITCLVAFLGFSTGIFTIGWSFVPELLPTCARGLGSGLHSAISSLFLFAIIKTTPYIIECYGLVVMYAFFGVSTFICGVILCFILPETNGKTLQSIEDSYSKDNVKPTPEIKI